MCGLDSGVVCCSNMLQTQSPESQSCMLLIMLIMGIYKYFGIINQTKTNSNSTLSETCCNLGDQH